MCIPRRSRARAVCRWAPTDGRCFCLSGGIDSPVAGYMIAKRGVKIDAVYFHAPPYTSERAKAEGCGSGQAGCQIHRPDPLHVVNFTDIQLYIYDQCPHEELTIIMRRYMMKIAETICKGEVNAWHLSPARASVRWHLRRCSPWRQPTKSALAGIPSAHRP
ncbi:MAG: hypothetical protein ACLUD2_12370 [Clostridium sp.]